MQIRRSEEGRGGSSCGRCRPAVGAADPARCFGYVMCGLCQPRRDEAQQDPRVRASVNFATRVATIDAVGMAADELCGVVEKAGYHAAPHTETTVLDKRTKDPDGAHARRLLRRLLVAAVLFVPLADLSTLFAIVPSARVPGWGYILTALAAPVVTWAAWPSTRSRCETRATGRHPWKR